MQDNQTTIVKSKTQKSWKWIILASFALNSMSNIFLYSGLSPIWSSVAIYYNVTDYDLNWLPNMYFISLMSVSFIFNPLILKFFGPSQILSCAFTTFGLWMLYMIGQNFPLAIVSFGILGLGEATYYQAPLHLSKIWFPNEERTLSTFCGQYASNLGILVSYLISAFYFYEIDDQDELNKRYENLILWNAFYASASLLFNFTTLKQPENNNQDIQTRDTIWESIIKICKAEEAAYDLISVSTFIGVCWCYPSFFGTQQYLIGQTTLQIFQINICFQVGQIIAATFSTWKLQKQSYNGLQQNYDEYIRYTVSIGFWSLVFEIMVFENLPFWILAILNILVGAGIGGFYSVLLESLMEKHYPVQELAIGSILCAVACSVSILLVMILSLPTFIQFGFQISCFIMIIPFCYMIVFYKTSFKRFEQEA